MSEGWEGLITTGEYRSQSPKDWPDRAPHVSQLNGSTMSQRHSTYHVREEDDRGPVAMKSRVVDPRFEPRLIPTVAPGGPVTRKKIGE